MVRCLMACLLLPLLQISSHNAHWLKVWRINKLGDRSSLIWLCFLYHGSILIIRVYQSTAGNTRPLPNISISFCLVPLAFSMCKLFIEIHLISSYHLENGFPLFFSYQSFPNISLFYSAVDNCPTNMYWRWPWVAKGFILSGVLCPCPWIVVSMPWLEVTWSPYLTLLDHYMRAWFVSVVVSTHTLNLWMTG